jgi:uncharacterized RDD family membrane protein YckC
MDKDKQKKTNPASGYLQIQTSEGLDYQLEIAGMGARSHAFIIDWHIRLLLALTWLVAIGLIFFTWQEIKTTFSREHSSAYALILLLPAGFIYFLYHPVLELIMAGRTPGKRMTGIRLVNLQGHTPGVASILLRNVFRLIDCLPGFYFLGLAAVALTRNQVRIGDLAAGLVLVYDDTINLKAMQQMTHLALHSRISSNDQALLLDLLSRWKELSSERRIHFAQQFLNRIGQDVPSPIKKNKLDEALKRALENLLNES